MISKIDHLLKSDEFRLFARPSGDIDKAVKMLPETTPDFLQDRFKTYLGISEHINPADQSEYRSLINEYTAFLKVFIKTLKTMRDEVKA